MPASSSHGRSSLAHGPSTGMFRNMPLCGTTVLALFQVAGPAEKNPPPPQLAIASAAPAIQRKEEGGESERGRGSLCPLSALLSFILCLLSYKLPENRAELRLLCVRVCTYIYTRAPKHKQPFSISFSFPHPSRALSLPLVTGPERLRRCNRLPLAGWRLITPPPSWRSSREEKDGDAVRPDIDRGRPGQPHGRESPRPVSVEQRP